MSLLLLLIPSVASLGLHIPAYLKLRRRNQQLALSEQALVADRAEFLRARMEHSARQGQLGSRMCNAGCGRVVHRYTVDKDDLVTCDDCKRKK